MIALRFLLASFCSAAVTLAQVPASAPDEVPARDRARGAAVRLELRWSHAGAPAALAIADDGRHLAGQFYEGGGCCGPPLARVCFADLDAPGCPLNYVDGRLAGGSADGFFLLQRDGDLVEADCSGAPRRRVCASSVWYPLAVGSGPGPRGPVTFMPSSFRALVCGSGPRFALAPQMWGCPGPPPPKGSIETRASSDASLVMVPASHSLRDWTARDDGALLCATAEWSGPSHVVHVAADGAQFNSAEPALTCDFALDGRHVLCADGQALSLLRLPDLALVRRTAGHASWLRAIDPVLALSDGTKPGTLTVWHVPTLTPLAELTCDGGPHEPRCAAVDRHRRWLAIAANDRVQLFAIVR